MPLVPASKYHCYGNDFLLVTARALGKVNPHDFAKAICDPHFGVGADGCIVIEKQAGNRVTLGQYNRDGSVFGMSGNGVRCAASFLVHEDLTTAPEIEFQTASGLKTYELLRGAPPRWTFRSRMGQPSFSTEDLPCLAPRGLNQIQDYPLPVAGRTVSVNVVWVGNPQCVVFGDRLPDDEEFHQLGSLLEVHDFFPERTNVSFVVRESEQSIRIRIWERGVGPTHSSGTGSCGAAVTAVHKGIVVSPVEVFTATGSQLVEWTSGKEIRLTGDCEFIAHVQFNFEAGRASPDSLGPPVDLAPGWE